MSELEKLLHDLNFEIRTSEIDMATLMERISVLNRFRRMVEKAIDREKAE